MQSFGEYSEGVNENLVNELIVKKIINPHFKNKAKVAQKLSVIDAAKDTTFDVDG